MTEMMMTATNMTATSKPPPLYADGELPAMEEARLQKKWQSQCRVYDRGVDNLGMGHPTIESAAAWLHWVGSRPPRNTHSGTGCAVLAASFGFADSIRLVTQGVPAVKKGAAPLARCGPSSMAPTVLTVSFDDLAALLVVVFAANEIAVGQACRSWTACGRRWFSSRTKARAC
jgi:hypothetical protein